MQNIHNISVVCKHISRENETKYRKGYTRMKGKWNERVGAWVCVPALFYGILLKWQEVTFKWRINDNVENAGNPVKSRVWGILANIKIKKW